VTLIPIQDCNCWLCGNTGLKLTGHHALPQHLKPKHNVIIPICNNCHQKVNANDITGMYSYAYKLERLGSEVRNGACKLLKTVKEHIDNKDKGKSLNKDKT